MVVHDHLLRPLPRGVARPSPRRRRRTRPAASWYLRQILGSANITGGPLFHILSGNLSHQIEHHLFPDLPAHRYPEIAPEVREICERYGLPYNTGGFVEAVRLDLGQDLQARAAVQARCRAGPAGGYGCAEHGSRRRVTAAQSEDGNVATSKDGQMVSRFEAAKDTAQVLTESAAGDVGRIALIIAGAVREVVHEMGEWATDAFEMRDAANRATADE